MEIIKGIAGYAGKLLLTGIWTTIAQGANTNAKNLAQGIWADANRAAEVTLPENIVNGLKYVQQGNLHTIKGGKR